MASPFDFLVRYVMPAVSGMSASVSVTLGGVAGVAVLIAVTIPSLYLSMRSSRNGRERAVSHE